VFDSKVLVLILIYLHPNMSIIAHPLMVEVQQQQQPCGKVKR
jgi:hypothetical protein